MEEIGRVHGISDYMQMRDARFPTGPATNALCHFALAFRKGVQFEIIQPLGEEDGLYRQILPGSGYATLFHHLGQHFASRADFDAALADARSRWPIPAGFETMGGVYAYADARKDMGHHLEFFSFPVGSHLDAVPQN